MSNRWLPLLILVSVAPRAAAISYEPEPAAEYVRKADTVAVVSVLASRLMRVEFEGKRHDCGFEVTAEVVDSIKGRTGKIRFLAEGVSMTVGRKYLVFLQPPPPTAPPERPEALFLGNNEYPTYCYANSSDLRASWLTISGFVGRWNREQALYEDWATLPYNISLPDDGSLRVQRVELRTLLVNDTEITKTTWLMSDGYALPGEMVHYDGAVEWGDYRRHLVEALDGGP